MSDLSIYESAVNSQIFPKLICLKQNLVSAAFELMKLLPAFSIISYGEKNNLINAETVVIETSSGTFGLGLAMVCAIKSYPLIIVSDPIIDIDFKNRIELLGARVEIVTTPLPDSGFQGARLKRMRELQQNCKNYFWPCQYDNSLNAQSYGIFAQYLLDNVKKIDYLVGPVGSGGSLCGTARYLRENSSHNPYIVGVDTQNSILFGMKDGPRALRGLGNSILPKNLDHTLVDEIHWVNAAEAYYFTHKLYQEHALFMGGTSGATYLVAKWIAEQHPDKNVVAIFPDTGHRYLSTIYNKHWLKENALELNVVPNAPISVTHPLQVNKNWSFLKWNRQPYDFYSSALNSLVL